MDERKEAKKALEDRIFDFVEENVIKVLVGEAGLRRIHRSADSVAEKIVRLQAKLKPNKQSGKKIGKKGGKN